MRELIQSGKLGEIVSARAQLTRWYPEMKNSWRQDIPVTAADAIMSQKVIETSYESNKSKSYVVL